MSDKNKNIEFQYEIRFGHGNPDKSYKFLMNTFQSEIEIDGIKYPSAAHAYNSFKTQDLKTKELLLKISHQEELNIDEVLKRNGGLNPYWDEIKELVMESILRKKFPSNQNDPQYDLTIQLCKTGVDKLINLDYYDRFYGAYYTGGKEFIGENKLGELLMKIRTERQQFW